MSSHYLNVAIGLSFTFLAVSLLCSATREAIASLFQTRAKMLLDAVLTMLHESAARPRLRGVLPSLRRLLRRQDGFALERLGNAPLTAAVTRHPLIVGLALPGRMPSYIPAPIFARAFVATLLAREDQQRSAQALLAGLGNDGLARTLRAIMGAGPDDVAALEEAVRIWYDTVMERTTGWYKRRSQCVLFLVGLFYAGAMNIDALVLSERLWQDSTTAAALARQGAEQAGGGKLQAAAGTLQAAVGANASLQQVAGLPIGWPPARFAQEHGHAGSAALALALTFAGWAVTAFAASLGAPFWFDGVGWLLALRGTGAKPPSGSSAAGAPGSTVAGPALPRLSAPRQATGNAAQNAAGNGTGNGAGTPP